MLDIKDRRDIYMKEFKACPFSTSDRPPSVCKACNLWLTFNRVKPENPILSSGLMMENPTRYGDTFLAKSEWLDWTTHVGDSENFKHVTKVKGKSNFCNITVYTHSGL